MVLQNSKLRVLFLTLTLTAALLGAQDLQVSARLYNEQVYFPDSPIDVLVTIENDHADAVSFRLADDRRFNVAFDIRTDTNRRLENTADFTIAYQANQQIFYRTVLLQPGEQLSFVERMTDYVAVEEPGLYAMTVEFYPRLREGSMGDPVRSNTVNLTVRPGSTPEIRREMRFEAIAQDQLRRQSLSPDDVVEYMLEARQANNWERFFLYLNLEKLFRQSPERDRSFVRLSQEEQLERLMTYREQLRTQESQPDSSLIAIPDEFQIIETRYTPTDGTVTARLSFDRESYRERRQYTYEMERRDGFWEIIGYQVSNLPNEALPQ